MSPEVSNGTSTSVIYRGVQAPGRRVVVSSRRTVTSVAKELGLRDSVLRRWVDKLRQEPASARWRPTTQVTPMSADQASEIARLRQETERARHFKKLSRAVARCAG